MRLLRSDRRAVAGPQPRNGIAEFAVELHQVHSRILLGVVVYSAVVLVAPNRIAAVRSQLDLLHRRGTAAAKVADGDDWRVSARPARFTSCMTIQYAGVAELGIVRCLASRRRDVDRS